MGYLVLILISVIWLFIIDKAIQKKFDAPKRSVTWHRHGNKVFAVLFYVVLAVYVLIPFVFPSAELFLLFPFAGAAMNLIFAADKYYSRKEIKLYVLYLSDMALWLVLGIAAVLFFG